MTSIATLELDIPGLPSTARKAHVFSEIHKPLLSIPQLCDAGCSVQFDETTVTVTNSNNEILLVGTRDPVTNLWLIPLGPASHLEMQQVLEAHNNNSHSANSA